jgi:hypothetical protein
MLKNDWLSHQIGALARALAVMMFRQHGEYNSPNEQSESGDSIVIREEELLSYMLIKYISDGKINEAENLLFESIENNSSEEKFLLALDFYKKLDEQSDSFLHENDYSRQEIFEGLSSIKRIYENKFTNGGTQ